MEKKKGRWKKVSAAIILAGLVLVYFAPSFLGSRYFRDWLIKEVLRPAGIEATIDDVSVGWFRPTRVKGVSLAPIGKPRLLIAKEIESDRSLLQAVFCGTELGTLTIREPEVHIHLDENSSNLEFNNTDSPKTDGDGDVSGEPDSSLSAKLDFNVVDAQLYVRTPSMSKEARVFSGATLRGQISQQNRTRSLQIQPGIIVENAQLTPELCAGGLKFVLPILAEATWTQGEFSIELEKCSVDLDEPRKTHIRGMLAVHGVEAGLRDEAWVDFTAKLTQTLGRAPFDFIVLADDSNVAFEVLDAQVWHDGVEFGLPRVSPDLVVRTRGRVGFDESLELDIDIPTPLNLLTQGPVARALDNQQLTLKATGTLKDPKVDMKNEDYLTDLLGGIGAQLATEDKPLESLMDGVRQALGRDDPDREGTPILDRIRERRQQEGGVLRRLFGRDR